MAQDPRTASLDDIEDVTPRTASIDDIADDGPRKPSSFGARVGESWEALTDTPKAIYGALTGDQNSRDRLTAMVKGLDPRNTTSPPAQINPVTAAARLEGINPDAIREDWQAGNLGALAGDVVIPAALALMPKVPVLRMAKGVARGVGQGLEVAPTGIGHYAMIGGALSGNLEKMAAGAGALVTAPLFKKAGTALRTWGESGGARPDLIPPTAPLMMTPPISSTFSVTVPSGRTGAVRMPVASGVRAADWAPPVREGAPAPAPEPVAPPPAPKAPPTEAELVAQRLAEIRASGGLPAGNADILPEMQARDAALRLGRTPIATTVEQSLSPTPAGGLHIDPVVAHDRLIGQIDQRKGGWDNLAQPQVPMRDNLGRAGRKSWSGMSPNQVAWLRTNHPEVLDALVAGENPEILDALGRDFPEVAKAYNIATGERGADIHALKQREAAERRNSQE